MAILVTGGAGYIGSHVARELLRSGEKVIVLDDLSRGHRSLVPRRCHFVEGSVGDRAALERLFREHDIESIIHLAAFVSVPESVAKPLLYYRNNRDNTQVLIQVAGRHQVKHFIFSSTAAVYGQPDITPVPEDAPLRPINPYGISKMESERFLSRYGRKYFEGWAALRYFNVAGADPKGRGGYVVDRDAGHLIRRSLLVALGQLKYLEILGTDYPTPDGTAIRDYIHVSDLSAAHVSVLRLLRKSGGAHVYNVGYEHGYSVLEVIAAAERATGKKIPVRFGPRRLGDPARVIASTARLYAETDWRPRLDNLVTIIRHEYRWVHKQLVHTK